VSFSMPPLFSILFAALCIAACSGSHGGKISNSTYRSDSGEGAYDENVQGNEDNTDGSLDDDGGDNYTKQDPGTNRWWSEWFGRQGHTGVRKVCPRQGFITKLTVHTGFWLFGQLGINKIAQVHCSGGEKLPCCDGQGGFLDKVQTFDRKNGFRMVSGEHKDKLTSLCFEGRRCGRSTFKVDCGRGFRVAGFQVRGSIHGIRFLCRRSRRGSGRPRRCGKLYPVPRRLCPLSYSLPNCFDGPVNAYCLATGRCRANTQLKNCDGRSVYVKL